MLKCTNSMNCRAEAGGQLVGTKRKTITITENQDNWIKSQISAGEFTNDSEYIRDLIRRDQTSQADIEVIRAALIEGEESGEPQPFDIGQFKSAMTAKHA
jgi:antitoxin ParD1/3/4